jgi:hypothetical protein
MSGCQQLGVICRFWQTAAWHGLKAVDKVCRPLVYAEVRLGVVGSPDLVRQARRVSHSCCVEQPR